MEQPMEQSAEINFSIVGYDPVSYWNRESVPVAELAEYRNPAGITWVYRITLLLKSLPK